MGKRSSFKRIERDDYETPIEALLPLLPHLRRKQIFTEPCAGRGELVKHLLRFGHVAAQAFDVKDRDACTAVYSDVDLFITNPPWSRDVLHAIIANLSNQAPTWLLIDADWAHTRQAIPYLDRLRKIVAIGRIKWIPGSSSVGKDNCCWHLFTRPTTSAAIEFVGRIQEEKPKRQKIPLAQR